MLKNLKKLREETGTTQKKLAEAIGISQQSINKYENHNIEPDINTLIMIADYFNTSVDYIVGHSTIRRRLENVRAYDLNEAESIVIDNYRQFNEKQKQLIELIINYLRFTE